MGLDAGELGEASPSCVSKPQMRKLLLKRRVAAGDDEGVVCVPHAAVQDDLVADLDVGDVGADGVDDAGGVAAADVEALLVAGVARLLVHADDVDRHAEARPRRCCS